MTQPCGAIIRWPGPSCKHVASRPCRPGAWGRKSGRRRDWRGEWPGHWTGSSLFGQRSRGWRSSCGEGVRPVIPPIMRRAKPFSECGSPSYRRGIGQGGSSAAALQSLRHAAPNVGAGLAPPNKGTASRAPTRTRWVPPPWKPRPAQIRALPCLPSGTAFCISLESRILNFESRPRCSDVQEGLRPPFSSFILQTSSFNFRTSCFHPSL